MVVNPEASFEPVRDAILDLRERVEELCNQELAKISKQGLSHESYLVLSFLLMSCLIVLHLPVCSLAVTDTTLFTLGDCKFQTFSFFSMSVRKVALVSSLVA